MYGTSVQPKFKVISTVVYYSKLILCSSHFSVRVHFSSYSVIYIYGGSLHITLLNLERLSLRILLCYMYISEVTAFKSTEIASTAFIYCCLQHSWLVNWIIRFNDKFKFVYPCQIDFEL